MSEDYVKKAQNEPDIVKTIGDKGYDVKNIGYDIKKTKVDPLTNMSYHDFLQYMPDEICDVPRNTWEPVAEAVAKMFEDGYVPMKVDDDSEDNK